MKKIKALVCGVAILVFASCSSIEKKQELKVLQINCWHGATTVPDAFRGLVSIIQQTDADVVLLSETHGSDGNVVDRLVDTLQVLGKTYYGESSGGSTGLISKYELVHTEKCCPSEVQGPMAKAYILVEGQTVAIYSAHLDYQYYECYLPRGYSGTSWEKLDAPVLDADSVLAANRLSQRNGTIQSFIKDAGKEIDKGHLVILGGDFNEPSHLDWQADTKDMRDHNGLVINWDCSVMLNEMGMKDSYRELFPNAITHPGFTFPSANKDAELSKLTWAPEADERDRIDFIYYSPNKSWTLSDVAIVGPSETIIRGEVKEKDSKDKFILPNQVWPTDHKGNLAVFSIAKQ